MRKCSKLVLLVSILMMFMSLSVASVFAQSNYPIILVGGWMSWGRAELEGFRYWGGLSDIQQMLRDKGYEVYTAEVSPLGSNWDRACELYAQIKGGAVDYGAGHSGYFGHGETTPAKVYAGFCPAWGTVDPATGQKRKVHLVGHSMGAQTIRYLAQLMENGSPTEQMVASVNPGYILSPLFAGSDATKGSIASVTSISGPHDGNTLVYLLGNQDVFGGYVSFFTALTSLATTDPAIDLKLDQWGISKSPGETDVQFIIRAMTNSPLAASLDSSLVDLSPPGAAYLNSQVAAQPNVYYFSYATSDSHESGGVQVPNANMSPFLVPGSTLEGQLLGEFGTPPYLITQSWWENDGLLPTVSQNGPKVGSRDAIVDKSAMTAAECDQDGVFQPGVWNYMGKIVNTDHYAVLGIRQDDPKVVAKDLRDFYLRIANTLRHLQ
ncbi:MAG TPA: hypothetical protein VF775_01640 [Geobacteraceae bacterium]